MQKAWINRTVNLDPETAELLEELLKVSKKSASAIFRESIKQEAEKLGVLKA